VTLPQTFSPRTIRDVEEAAAWLAERDGGEQLARRFARAVGAAAGRIARRPMLGHRRLALLPDPYRFHAVTGFDDLLVYDIERVAPPILRVLHMSRDLGPLLADFLDAPRTSRD
jgi:plasmid stabilization system protein ParE